jgi:hypothetical protein
MCFEDPSNFALAVNSAPAHAQLELLCPAVAPCGINGTHLGTAWSMEATLMLENVVLQHTPAVLGLAMKPETLLQIKHGSLQGTSMSFRGGISARGDGCVSSYGTFRCEDCIFSNCTADEYNREMDATDAIEGGLQLIRPEFFDGTCGAKVCAPTPPASCGAARSKRTVFRVCYHGGRSSHHTGRCCCRTC